MTVTSRSGTRQRNETTVPSRHISVRTVSPGEDGRGEADVEADQTLRLIVAELPEDGVTRHAVSAKPVQDRAVKASLAGERRIAVQQIAISVEPIKERRLGHARQIDDRVRAVVRHGVGRSERSRRSAKNPP